MAPVYIIYCTTNKLNAKYYIGVHKTSKLDDGYLGSGKILKRSIAKYGVDAFDKEICFVYDNAVEAFAKEKLLVRVHRRNKLCMNIREGGAGGWGYINENGLRPVTPPNFPLLGRIAAHQKMLADPMRLLRRRIRARDKVLTTRGQKTTGQAVHALNMLFQPRLNWVTNGQDVKHVPAAQLPKWLDAGWQQGKIYRHVKKLRQRRWITDGQRNVAIFEASCPPTGWKFGRVITPWSEKRQARIRRQAEKWSQLPVEALSSYQKSICARFV